MNRLGSIFLASGLLFAVGCKDAVVDDIGINLNVKNADDNGAGLLITEKNINTEQGNPYGAFLTGIKNEFGEDPVFIDLESATITLVGGNQASLEELYTGVVTLAIVDETAGTTTTIATIDSPTGVGPLDFEIASDAFDDDAFQATLNDGQFKIQLSGVATDAAANINTDIEAVLSFSADK